MQNLEKDFGTRIDETRLVSAEDLMSLQTMDDSRADISFEPCTLCTWTCWNTAAPSL